MAVEHVADVLLAGAVSLGDCCLCDALADELGLGVKRRPRGLIGRHLAATPVEVVRARG